MGDPTFSGTLVTETENAFSVAYDDAFHAVVAGMIQDLPDTVSIRIAEKRSPRGCFHISLNRWQPSPTVGVYTRGSIS